MLIRLALTSPVSAPSSQTLSGLKFPIVHSESQLHFVFVFFFVNNIKIDPNYGSRRRESSEARGGWISSVTPAAAVESETLVVFSGSGSGLHWLLGGRSTTVFPPEVLK